MKHQIKLAKMSQVNEINQRYDRIESEKRHSQAMESARGIWQYIEMLEDRIKALEEKFPNP